MMQRKRWEECVDLIREWLEIGDTVGIRARLRARGYGESSITRAEKEIPGLISIATDGTNPNSRRWTIKE